MPEDVAPLNTVEIVEHIRCEMYDALRQQVITAFKLSHKPGADAVAADIEANPETSLDKYESKRVLLDDVYQTRIEKFKKTEIGYGFRFNITEKNTRSGDLTLTLPWNPLSNFSLKANAGLINTRANTRRFYKFENFDQLTKSADCLAKKLNGPNFVYPITGTIGLHNVVTDFVKLTTRGAEVKKADQKDVQNFSEVLTFTTDISGGLNPKVKLATVTDALKLTDLNVNLSDQRIDIHELTVTFALPSDFYQRGAAIASARGAAVDELNKLRFLDAVERGGATVLP